MKDKLKVIVLNPKSRNEYNKMIDNISEYLNKKYNGKEECI